MSILLFHEAIQEVLRRLPCHYPRCDSICMPFIGISGLTHAMYQLSTPALLHNMGRFMGDGVEVRPLCEDHMIPSCIRQSLQLPCACCSLWPEMCLNATDIVVAEESLNVFAI